MRKPKNGSWRIVKVLDTVILSTIENTSSARYLLQTDLDVLLRTSTSDSEVMKCCIWLLQVRLFLFNTCIMAHNTTRHKNCVANSNTQQCQSKHHGDVLGVYRIVSPALYSYKQNTMLTSHTRSENTERWVSLLRSLLR